MDFFTAEGAEGAEEEIIEKFDLLVRTLPRLLALFDFF
jgi:hypothetical protein